MQDKIHQEAIELNNKLKELKKTKEYSYNFRRLNLIHIMQSEQVQEKISCKGSCSFCCHDKILMTKTEANIILNRITSKEISYSFNKERALKQKLAEENNTKLLFNDMACPMLLDANTSGNRLCSIYEDRPLVCINHNSVDDKNKCNKQDEFGNYVITNINEIRVSEAEAISLSQMIEESENVPKESFKNPETLSKEIFLSMHDLIDFI